MPHGSLLPPLFQTHAHTTFMSMDSYLLTWSILATVWGTPLGFRTIKGPLCLSPHPVRICLAPSPTLESSEAPVLQALLMPSTSPCLVL